MPGKIVPITDEWAFEGKNWCAFPVAPAWAGPFIVHNGQIFTGPE